MPGAWRNAAHSARWWPTTDCSPAWWRKAASRSRFLLPAWLRLLPRRNGRGQPPPGRLFSVQAEHEALLASGSGHFGRRRLGLLGFDALEDLTQADVAHSHFFGAGFARLAGFGSVATSLRASHIVFLLYCGKSLADTDCWVSGAYVLAFAHRGRATDNPIPGQSPVDGDGLLVSPVRAHSWVGSRIQRVY